MENLPQNGEPGNDVLTADIIGAAIEVHRTFGPGLIESIYEKCLAHELSLRGHSVRQQAQVQIEYKGLIFEETLRCDLLVDDKVLVELKAVEAILPVHKAQTLSYMKLLRLHRGLLINFHQPKLIDGVSRLSL